MTTFKCNSCGATYLDQQRDGTRYFHACGPQITKRAVLDAAGATVTPQVEAEIADGRNENTPPGLLIVEGKLVRSQLIPGETGLFQLVPADTFLISEGKGRTQIAP